MRPSHATFLSPGRPKTNSLRAGDTPSVHLNTAQQGVAAHTFLSRLPTLLALSCLVLGLAACRQEPPPPTVTRVKTVVVEPEALAHGAQTLPGVVVARVESTLSFRVGGRILARPADVGSMLEKDGLLAQLDPEPFRLAMDEATAQVAQARVVMERNRRDVARYQNLIERGAVARADFDALQTSLGNAKAQYDAAQSRLEQAKNNLAYANLTMPETGVVTQVQAQVGQVVAAGTPVATVAYEGQRELLVDVPENRIANILAGAAVQASLLSNPDTLLQGKVREVSPVADPATRTYRVRITLDDMPNSARLGMTASVRFGTLNTAETSTDTADTSAPAPAPTHDAQVFRLPLSALTQQGDQPAVWVLPEGAHTLSLRPVKLGAMGSDHILVIDGLKAGERVVTAGVHRLDANMDVQVWDGRLP